MTNHEEPSQDSPESPVDSFLSQTAYSVDEDVDEVIVEPDLARAPGLPRGLNVRKRFGHWFTHFMFEKEPSQYSSIAPRKADGTRSKIFFINGNGRGR
jgi:hypothetical protein